jgi:hypothetical protein
MDSGRILEYADASWNLRFPSVLNWGPKQFHNSRPDPWVRRNVKASFIASVLIGGYVRQLGRTSGKLD